MWRVCECVSANLSELLQERQGREGYVLNDFFLPKTHVCVESSLLASARPSCFSRSWEIEDEEMVVLRFNQRLTDSQSVAVEWQAYSGRGGREIERRSESHFMTCKTRDGKREAERKEEKKSKLRANS